MINNKRSIDSSYPHQTDLTTTSPDHHFYHPLTIDLPAIEPFDHQRFESNHLIPPLSSSITILTSSDLFYHELDHSNQSEHHPWFDLYSQDLSHPSGDRSDPDHDQHTQPLDPQSNLVFSWDSFDRPVGSQSPLVYQTPYPVERSIPVWEAILSSAKSNLSHPIDRTRFITDFFRRSIGLKTLQPSLNPSHRNLPARVLGLTDKATRRLDHLSGLAYENLSTIERFIKLKHHPHHQPLTSSLIILVDWIRTEIMDCFDQELVLESGLVSLSLILEPIFNLLAALANLTKSCEQDHRSMYEETVYQHLNDHLLRASSNLIQAVFTWVLDRVCGALLQSWQTWLGVQLACQPTVWGDEKDRLYRSLWSRYGIHADLQRSRRSAFDLLVDQPDQLGQAPISYRVLS